MTVPLGWCLTGHHSECWIATIDDRRCSCSCHVKLTKRCDWCEAKISLTDETCSTCGEDQLL